MLFEGGNGIDKRIVSWQRWSSHCCFCLASQSILVAKEIVVVDAKLLVPFVRFGCDVREGLCPEPDQPSKPTISTHSLRCRDTKNTVTMNKRSLPKCGCSPVFYSGKVMRQLNYPVLLFLDPQDLQSLVRSPRQWQSWPFRMARKSFIIGPTPFTPFTRTNTVGLGNGSLLFRGFVTCQIWTMESLMQGHRSWVDTGEIEKSIYCNAPGSKLLFEFLRHSW